MSSFRSVGFAGVVLLFASGAIVAMALSVEEPRPVDARQVEVGPAVPGVLSASHTTTIQIARPTATAVAIAPPAPRPAPPQISTTPPATTEPSSPPPSTSAPETTSSTPPPWGEDCDRSYVTDGVCVPRFFPPGVWRKCDWLYEQGVTRIEVVGWDRHFLDRDRDGVACERDD